MFIRFLRVLHKTLAPTGGAFGADPPDAFGWESGERHGLSQLVGGFYPRHHHAVGANVQRSLDEADVQFGHAHQYDRIPANRRADMLDNLLPVEEAVSGVDH